MTGLLDPIHGISKLEKELLHKQSALDDIKHLFKKLPDLLLSKQNISVPDFISCSASMNSSIDGFEVLTSTTETFNLTGETIPTITHNVWLYTTIDSKRIYSNPPCFTIGAQNNEGFGIEPNPSWETEMEEVGITLSIIRKVRAYLKAKPPISYHK